MKNNKLLPLQYTPFYNQGIVKEVVKRTNAQERPQLLGRQFKNRYIVCTFFLIILPPV